MKPKTIIFLLNQSDEGLVGGFRDFWIPAKILKVLQLENEIFPFSVCEPGLNIKRRPHQVRVQSSDTTLSKH